MKKSIIYALGLLTGILLTVSGSAFADDVKSLMNSKVSNVWEMYVNGEKAGSIPIIEGKSYAPVRQIAEIAGFEVDFVSGKVFLEGKEGEDLSGSDVSTNEDIHSRIDLINSRIESDKLTIEAYESLIERDKENESFYREKIAEVEKRIDNYNKEIEELISKLVFE